MIFKKNYKKIDEDIICSWVRIFLFLFIGKFIMIVFKFKIIYVFKNELIK